MSRIAEMYLELGEEGDAGVDIAPREREVEPRELAGRVLQLRIHGLRGSLSLHAPAVWGVFLSCGRRRCRGKSCDYTEETDWQSQTHCACQEYVFLFERRAVLYNERKHFMPWRLKK